MNEQMVIHAGENLNFAGIEVLDCNGNPSTKVTRLGKVYVQKECTGLAKAPGFYDLRRSMSMDFFYACICYAA